MLSFREDLMPEAQFSEKPIHQEFVFGEVF